MLINGIELSSLGIQLYDRVLYGNNIDTMQDWLDGDIQPTFIRQQDRFKNIKLDFLVLCADEDEAFLRISKLTAMLKKATIKFDDLNFTFDVNIVDTAKPTRLKNGNFIVSYNLTSGYAKGEREIYTTNANMTNSFKLTLAYYHDDNKFISTESITIRASSFNDGTPTLEDLGIDVNKHRLDYYNNGIITNLVNMELTYDNLKMLQALIINYTPMTYNLTVNYYMSDDSGRYVELLSRIVPFTQPMLSTISTIGNLVNVASYRPEGYKARIAYDKDLTVEDLLAESTISVFYDKIQNELSKNILVYYKAENDEGLYDDIDALIVNVKESQFYDGLALKDIISISAYRPSTSYYKEGYIEGHKLEELITFNSINNIYEVKYPKATNTIYLEYYAGVYPDWYRLTSLPLHTKYKSSYEDSFDVIQDLNIDLNKYHTTPYEDGALYNQSSYQTYDDVINAGVLQIYYKAIDYPITVNYYTNGIMSVPITETVYINDLMFFNEPILSDIIPILAHKPEGYQFSEDFSYDGEISLSALTQSSPISIVYEEISEMRNKNIIVRYKQELSSTYSTITTTLITISEADVIGGVRLKDIISLNAYQPEYYESGIIDGASSTALLTYDQIGSNYDVLYVAKSYTTPVRYYVDEVSDLKWIGSSNITYRVIDFEVSTTLFDFGLDLNMYKPSYTGDGILQYTGMINFTSLLELESIDVLYITETTPPDEEGIDYPHRFLYLQHNDLGAYEYLHPEWTMNHAYINTGISAQDMSKLTVIMECARVDENVPLYQVNAGYGYLFGSYSALGAYFMRYNNQTMYGEGLTGVNTYEAKAGAKSDVLVLTEDSAIGFSENTGIYSSPQQGYSRAVFTYTNTLATDGAQMPYPLYLFANNYNGSYSQGLAGIGIYSCRIYYNDQLIRDYIPVQFYDKIGDKVAPSNCLYDKITKTFFEDETGLNSFNIRDDERYTDTNLQHKIGHCYINYYKGTDFIKTTAIYFRGDEFADNNFDLYDRFLVDKNQPQYCKSGEIRNVENITVSFDGLNNKVFEVYYEPISTQIEVNYYQQINGTEVLLATDNIVLEEKDFYQVPTFGDLVRLNKYKPEGYETDFKYAGSKVSLARVVEGSPYKIVYKPIEEEIVNYTTVIRYIKKVYGVREYETIGTQILTFDQSNFRDGEYIDFYIDKNLMKPEKYYKDGVPYQWYEMDERLTNPTDLKDSYVIVFMPETQYLDVNYYTDELDEENLIASTTWGIAIDELEPGYTYSVAEILPNSYINKFKPVICNGGMVQGADVRHTFESLVELGYIDILYETIIEPDDPTNAVYEGKVLGWGRFTNTIPAGTPGLESRTFALGGGTIPWIDLGYRPKELKRLRIEAKAVSQACGYLTGNVVQGGFIDTSYVDWLGYRVPRGIEALGLLSKDKIEEDDLGNMYSVYIKDTEKGHLSISSYLPTAGGWVYSAEGPQSMDGQIYYTAGAGSGVISNIPQNIYYGNPASYRRGYATILDENWEEIDCFNQYGIEKTYKISKNWIVNTDRYGVVEGGRPIHQISNPITTIIDAYNGYATCYNEEDSNQSQYIIFDDLDNDIFEARLAPKGSITLFRTRNPLTGNVNIMPFNLETRAGHTSGFPMALQGANNPYTGEYKELEYEVLVQTGTDTDGNPIFQTQIQRKNVKYGSFPVPVYPQQEACAIWGVKIYDRGRLVRDLIPVAKGDKIYDYIMPENGLFDLITEIFFGNSNNGGKYTITTYFANENAESNSPQLSLATKSVEVKPEDVQKLWVIDDPSIWGKMTINYYDYDYTFINNLFVSVPTWYSKNNTTIGDILYFNEYKPNEFYLDGILDIDTTEKPFETLTTYDIYKMGAGNVWYKLRTFTKTVVYYQNNYRIGSKDIFYSLEDIENANTLADLNIEVDLYYDEKFKHGRIVFDETILASNDIKAFIDAPSPVVIYDKLSKEEAPNLFYVEYYRGGASDDTLITINEESPNYLDCNLDGVVLNPYGAIKYYNHYHSALYEDEEFEYFIPYQVKVLNKYTNIHIGPAKKFSVLGSIVIQDIYTITEERNGWGRLKEYPVGWIELSHTEPMTGPGQNPDYDIANEETATLPFKSPVHISKMTIDRLWCYIPEVESWVKAEDLSFNQTGKLYNALGITVIDLSLLDFSTIDSLDKIGIYPEAKLLYFHDRVNYTYDGDYTYEAFSNLHELEFIYDETIYHYNCIYYKDSLPVEGSDFNPEIGRASFSCSLSDWNPDWDTFIATSWLYDEEGNPINPTIYRDTELKLNWDYFGFERNLFKPDGYPDGIYLWDSNPCSGKNNFTFNELIRIGTQYVLYPNFDPTLYKIWVVKDITGYYQGRISIGGGSQYEIWNYYTGTDDLIVDLSTPTDSVWNMYYTQADLNKNIVNTTYVGEFEIPPKRTITLPRTWQAGTTRSDSRERSNLTGTKNSTGTGMHNAKYSSSKIEYLEASLGESYQTIDFGYPLSSKDSFKIELNEDLNKATGYLVLGNEYSGAEKQRYIYGKVLDNSRYGFTPMADNINVKNYNYSVKSSGSLNKVDLKNTHLCGIILSAQSYENSLMRHYYVPVPKGFRYIYNNEKLQITDNGLYDLLTGNFVRGYKVGDPTDGSFYKINDKQHEKNYKIFLREQEPIIEDEYNYFDNWTYNTTDIDYIVKIQTATSSYKQPDIYSTGINKLAKNLVLPVSKLTADNANEVIGEWYYSGDQWFESKNATIYAGSFDKNKLTKLQRSICLVNPSSSQTYYVYLDPSTVGTPGESSNASYSKNVVINSYYYYTDENNNVYHFDGAYWIPEKYTSLNTVEHNKNYAIIPDRVPYYSYPIESDEYLIGYYHYGERITIPYLSNQNNNWGYTGLGWIRATSNNLSEIVS